MQAPSERGTAGEEQTSRRSFRSEVVQTEVGVTTRRRSDPGGFETELYRGSAAVGTAGSESQPLRPDREIGIDSLRNRNSGRTQHGNGSREFALRCALVEASSRAAFPRDPPHCRPPPVFPPPPPPPPGFPPVPPPPELRKEKVKTSLMAENSGAIESRT